MRDSSHSTTARCVKQCHHRNVCWTVAMLAPGVRMDGHQHRHTSQELTCHVLLDPYADRHVARPAITASHRARASKFGHTYSGDTTAHTHQTLRHSFFSFDQLSVSPSSLARCLPRRYQWQPSTTCSCLGPVQNIIPSRHLVSISCFSWRKARHHPPSADKLRSGGGELYVQG